MRPLRYSINITLDGCADHRAGVPTEETHLHAARGIAESDALLLGRTTYELMESGWRNPNPAMPESLREFASIMNAAKKYVVSTTLKSVDWTGAELITGDLATRVRELKSKNGRGLATGGVTLPLALAKLGLIDEYEFVVHPRIAGHGPTVLAGLSQYVDLKLVGRTDFAGGLFAVRYVPK
ncbi:MAG: dihydrofolate reductase family protein [Archangium sp.]|nr:dihydrofolate reductase family protein [Archangium sp.]